MLGAQSARVRAAAHALAVRAETATKVPATRTGQGITSRPSARGSQVKSAFPEVTRDELELFHGRAPAGLG